MKKDPQICSGLALVGEELAPLAADIVIENGTIVAIEENPRAPPVWICPALFNAHTHLGDTIAMDCGIDRRSRGAGHATGRAEAPAAPGRVPAGAGRGDAGEYGGDDRRGHGRVCGLPRRRGRRRQRPSRKPRRACPSRPVSSAARAAR